MNYIMRTYISDLNEKRMTLGKFTDILLFIILSAFVLYTVWFQYAVHEIGGLISLAGILMLAFSVLEMLFKKADTLSVLLPFFAFLLYVLLTGLAFAKYNATFADMMSQMLKYVIPMIAIITYVGYERRKANHVFILFSIAATILSVSVFVSGTKTSTNAITLGDYNTNTLSCVLILGLFCSLMQFYEYRKNNKIRILLLGCILILSVAQVIVASRRGVIIHTLLLIMYLIAADKANKKDGKSSKLGIVIIGFGVAAYFAYVFFGDKLESLAIVQRFFGAKATEHGDSLRHYYQSTALRLFNDHPIFGVGIGGVAGEIGVYSHSFFHELLACSGLVGLFLMLYLFIKFMRYFNILKKMGDANGHQLTFETVFCMCFCICVLLSGFAVVMIYDVFFYYVLGILASLINVYETENLRPDIL